jgi:hypothetical protein
MASPTVGHHEDVSCPVRRKQDFGAACSPNSSAAYTTPEELGSPPPNVALKTAARSQERGRA